MQEPRLCRKCQEPIPESRGPRAEDCGLPKCKSKAYRLQKKAEAEAMAAALAEKQSDEKESKSANGLAIPIQDREPEQHSTPSAPSCESVGSAASVQEVRLQPGQQSIVLVCGCGARTTIQISHIRPDSIPVAIPPVTETTAEVSLHSSVSIPSVTDASETELEIANRAPETVASPVSETVASREDSSAAQIVASTTLVPPALPVASLIESVGSEVPAAIALPSTPNASVGVLAVPEPTPSAQTRSTTDDRARLVDGRPNSMPFKVYEMYAYRKNRLDERLLIQDVMLPTGEVRVDCRVTATTDPAEGFRLCEPTNDHMVSWGKMFKHGGCQIPGKLIVCAHRIGEQGKVTMHYVDVERIKQVLGRYWKNCFDR